MTKNHQVEREMELWGTFSLETVGLNVPLGVWTPGSRGHFSHLGLSFQGCGQASQKGSPQAKVALVKWAYVFGTF